MIADLLADARIVRGSGHRSLRVTYVARSFLDYRIPVFAALDKLCGAELRVVYSRDYVPERVREKIEQALGTRAIGLAGEWKVGAEDRQYAANANTSLRFHPGLVRVIGETKPDVVVSDGFFKWTLGAILYKLKRNVPLVLCYERTFHTERNAQLYRTVYRRAVARYVDAMCCNGRLSASYARWLGAPPNRIFTGHMAADVETMAARAARVDAVERRRTRDGWGVTGVCFLYVGRLLRLKGIEELLRAWTRFEAASPTGGTLVLVGDGPERERNEEQARRSELRNVRFIGAVDYDRLAPFYRAGDVFVMPTLEDNWSLVVPEAMACGLPILCSKYNGCWPELVEPGANGWVFDPMDIEDTLQRLQWCAAHSDALHRMGASSKAIVAAYTPATAAESIMHACERALDHRAPTRHEADRFASEPVAESGGVSR